MPHIPVLLKETIEYLAVKRGGKYIDATYGGGGHSRAIAERGGQVLGIDLDSRLRGNDIRVVHGNFADIGEIARENGFTEVDGILFDLGLSSEQLDDPKRGFSFQKDGPLDMRMSPLGKFQITNSKSQTAAEIINFYSEKELIEIFYKYGEERRFGRRVARALLDARKLGSIKTTAQLFDIIKRALPASLRFRAGDTARRIFQALRIAVNRELENLERALPQALGLLKGDRGDKGGRIVVISFHSLEDRIVKKFMTCEAKGCVCPPEFPQCVCGKTPTLKILTKKPVTAADEEIKQNPRSKSAKLRAAMKF